MIHVAVVDDHAIVRAGLTTVLGRESDMTVVGAFAHGDAFFKGLPRIERLDVVLFDVTMPLIDGLEAVERLHMRRTPPATLMLSMHADRATIDRARSLGARGFLSKEADDERVVQAVRTVAWGGTVFPDQDSLAEEHTSRSAQGGLDALSEQERHVFQLLYRGATQKEIARDLDVSPKTVSTYKARIMTKLGLTNIVELIRFGDRASGKSDA